MARISQYHIDEFERQGCCDWNEYCNLNMLNYEDLLEDEEYEDNEWDNPLI